MLEEVRLVPTVSWGARPLVPLAARVTTVTFLMRETACELLASDKSPPQPQYNFTSHQKLVPPPGAKYKPLTPRRQRLLPPPSGRYNPIPSRHTCLPNTRANLVAKQS